MGLLPPQSGQIFIDEIDIYKNNLQNDWTSNISHVPQNIFLKEGTISENIVFGDSSENIDLDLLEKASEIAKISKFIKETKDGFQSLVGERGIRLSGGQRQRIAIARAIYRFKDLLVLDEATSALDQNTEKLIIDSILNKFTNLTIVMVTHRMKSLQNCNRVFEVKTNGIIEEK